MSDLMTKAELIEELAAIEHDRWSDWQKWVHECAPESHPTHNKAVVPGSRVLPPELHAHWERLIATDYTELPEHSKQADREQVARYMPLIVDFVSAWLEANGGDPGDYFVNVGEYLSEQWRKDMASR